MRAPVRADVPDGEHSYTWDDESEYYGEWAGGQASGRGTFVWPSGDPEPRSWFFVMVGGAGGQAERKSSACDCSRRVLGMESTFNHLARLAMACLALVRLRT